MCQRPYGPPNRYSTGSTPSSVIAGDFNNDAKLDLAVANLADSTISMLLSNGDGTFQNQTTYSTGTGPNSITSGDFNNDMKLDLAVVNFYDNNISVLLGNGDGTFQNQTQYAAGPGPISMIVGDFNNDNNLDLAVANYNDEPNNIISVLFGNGDGTFQNQVKYIAGKYPRSQSVCSATSCCSCAPRTRTPDNPAASGSMAGRPTNQNRW